MKRSLHGVLQALLAGLIILISGCSKSQMSPMKFSFTLARALDRLSSSGRQFTTAILDGKYDVAEGAYSGVQKAVQEAKKEIDELPPPVNSPPGAEVLAKAREFMTVEEAIFNECVTPMLQIVRDNATYPDKQAKWNAVAQLMFKMRDMEKPPHDNLLKAHEEFCKYHKFEPK